MLAALTGEGTVQEVQGTTARFFDDSTKQEGRKLSQDRETFPIF